MRRLDTHHERYLVELSGPYPRKAFDLDGRWAIYEIDPHRRNLVVVDICDHASTGLDG